MLEALSDAALRNTQTRRSDEATELNGGDFALVELGADLPTLFNMKQGDVRIGISGWRYAPWRQQFYPTDLAQRRELEYASSQFRSIELNGSFYALQKPQSYRSWYAETPADFQFSVKAPRFITHIRRLRDVEKPLANFFASGLFELREKLGPILWQLPPSLRYDSESIETFLALLPHDSETARRLARKCESRMQGRSSLSVDRKRAIRHAIEVRHPSFIDAGFIAQLRRYKVALVIADTAGRWPRLFDVTAGFVYLRLHGDETLYRSGYTDAALKPWARAISQWRRGAAPARRPQASKSKPAKRTRRDVFCYFDNDQKIKAPVDARRLRELIADI